MSPLGGHHPEQLSLLLDELAREAGLADRLVDRRRMPPTGAARLLKALVMRELEPAALPAAALLVVELDAQARRDERLVERTT